MNPSIDPRSVLSFCVLAGGKSSRMGQDKGLLQLGHKPMIKYLLDTLKEFQLPVYIIANDANYHSLGYPVFEDLYLEIGPMGGLFTAFTYCRSKYLLLMSCDSPFISYIAIEKLMKQISEDNIIVSVIEDKLNPLFAIYPTSLMDIVLQNILEEKLKMTDFIKSVPYKIVKMDSLAVKDPFEFYNINSPSDVIHCKSKWECIL